MHKRQPPNIQDIAKTISARRKLFKPLSTPPSHDPYPKHKADDMRPSLLKRRLLEANTSYVPTYKSCYVNYCSTSQLPNVNSAPIYEYSPPANGYGNLSGSYTSKYPPLSYEYRNVNWNSPNETLLQARLRDPLFRSIQSIAANKDEFIRRTLKSVRTIANKDEFIRNTLQSVRRSNELGESRLDFKECERLNTLKRKEFVKYYSSYEEPNDPWKLLTMVDVTATTPNVETDEKKLVETKKPKPESGSSKSNSSDPKGSIKMEPVKERNESVRSKSSTISMEMVVTIKKALEKESDTSLQILQTKNSNVATSKDTDVIETSTPKDRKDENLKVGALSDILRHEDWMKVDSKDFLKSFKQLKSETLNTEAAKAVAEVVNVTTPRHDGAKSRIEFTENMSEKITVKMEKSLNEVISAENNGNTDVISKHEINSFKDQMENLSSSLSAHQKTSSNSTETIRNVKLLPKNISNNSGDKINEKEFMDEYISKDKNIPKNSSNEINEKEFMDEDISKDKNISNNSGNKINKKEFMAEDISKDKNISNNSGNKINEKEFMDEDIAKDIEKSLEKHFSRLTNTPKDSESTVGNSQVMYNTFPDSTVYHISCPNLDQNLITFIKRNCENRCQSSPSVFNSDLDPSEPTLLKLQLNFSDAASDYSLSNRLHTTLAFPSDSSSYNGLVSKESFSSDAVSLYLKNLNGSSNHLKAIYDRVSHVDSKYFNILGDMDSEIIRKGMDESVEMFSEDLDKFTSRDKILNKNRDDDV